MNSIPSLFLFILTILSVSSCANQKNTEHPFEVLKNDSVEVTVLLPDSNIGYYRSTRF